MACGNDKRLAARIRRFSLAAELRLSCVALWCGFWLAPAALAQQVQDPVGLLLVASPEVRDRNFARTVVLVTRTPQGETIGVILNRRYPAGDAPVPLPEHAKVRDIYFGGPLSPRGLLAVADLGQGNAAGVSPPPGASPDAPERASIEVLPGVHLVAGAARVRELVQGTDKQGTDRQGADPQGTGQPGAETQRADQQRAEAAKIRVFAGYAGWAPGQLENEIARGGWRVLPASAEWLFDEAPESLWERLSARLKAVRCDDCAAPGVAKAAAIAAPTVTTAAAGTAGETVRLQRLLGTHVVHPVDRPHVDVAHFTALQHLERHRYAGAALRPELAIKLFERFD